MDQETTTDAADEISLIYDGECPLCSRAAHVLRIREAVGRLNLINARQEPTHSLTVEAGRRGYDLDTGMVVYYGARFYHGADALRLLALLGSEHAGINRLNALLFRSRWRAAVAYPALRALRNLLIRIKGIPKIANLERLNAAQPIFQPIFGDSWHNMPLVLRKRYANRPFCLDEVPLEGTLDITLSPLTRLMKPLLRLFGALVPYEGERIPTSVSAKSDPRSRHFLMERMFHFPNRAPYLFRSTFVPVRGNEVIEIMKFGIGWRCHYVFDGAKVRLIHKGYAWRIGRLSLPLPLGLLLGRGHAEEEAVDDDQFLMRMTIHHPWFGTTFEYRGRFRVL